MGLYEVLYRIHREREYPTTNTTIPDPQQLKWADFSLGDIFEKIYKAKANIKSDIETYAWPNENTVPFVSRTESNNGCDCFVEPDESMGIEEGNAIIIGDTTSTMFYQAQRFVAGDHIVVCRSSWMNCERCLFLLSILQKERFRYSYGRAFTMELIRKTKIKLPCKNGEPDWQAVDAFIESVPYADLL